MAHVAYIGLGSNQGDRIAILENALLKINQIPKTRIKKRSSWYETEAVGGIATQDFINAVVQIETESSPGALMRALLEIEKDLGRIRNEKWGDRSCDLDLIIYDSLVQNQPECTLPHPGLPERKFVLVPLEEISPNLVVPGISKKVCELVRLCSDSHQISRLHSKS